MVRLRSLRARLALWICGATAVSLAVFGIVAYIVVMLEEEEEARTHAEEETAADVRNEVLTGLAFAGPVGIILAGVGAMWLSRRALAPVDRVIEAASAMPADRLDRRLPVPRQPGELHDLVTALNGLLTRI